MRKAIQPPTGLTNVETRILAIRSDKYVVFDSFGIALNAMRVVHKQPRKIRPDCLYVHGDTGMGKSALATNFAIQCGAELDDRDRVIIVDDSCPVLLLDLTRLLAAKSIQTLIVETLLGSAVVARAINADAAAGNFLERYKVRTLVLDEFNDLTRHGPAMRMRVMSSIRSLSNEFRIGIIALGLYELSTAVLGDDHLMSRFKTVALEHWRESEMLRAFVSHIVSDFHLHRGFDVDNPDFMQTLVFAAEAANGRATTAAIVDLLRETGVRAILTGTERIDLEILKRQIKFRHLEDLPDECEAVF